MPSLQAPKRSACDRCRIQKLRCPPGPQGTEACARCTRLGAACLLSFPRPSNAGFQNVAPSQGQPELRPKATTSLPSPAATVTTANSISRPNDIISEPMNDQSPRPTNGSVTYDPLSFSMDDNFDYFSDQTATLHLGSLGGSNNDSISSLFGNDSQTFVSLSPTRIDGGGGSLDLSDSSESMQNAGSDMFLNDQAIDIFQYNTRLCSLNLDLSKRLEQCLASGFEDTPLLLDPRSEADNSDHNAEGRDGINSLFEHALGDLAEFLVIIQSYTSRRNNQTIGASARDIGHDFLSGPGNAPTYRISLVVFLNLISAYLQIIVIYEKIFRSLSSRLFGGSMELSAGRAAAVRPNSISTGRNNLQTKLLIHAILHQFDVVERMLGLPIDLRVTSQGGAYQAGLFEDDRARGLLGAVSNGNRIENGWGSNQISMDDHRSSKALTSLREMFGMVHVFLDI
ncbi:hypothetical protein BCR34DRAFT_617988 [Clohesyomyces aquaticus]|uniref:Zn(2)-C6 fungal-type domain-containing protein n=1 Tax=Clohesyomyces aquaticus TaxID=1231657 RepID=A0A1Y1YXQ1_9PLEO|nr:hypothetical protein BCR34DRAFT_617988 [Clohesyomyces aquaticus]